MPNISIPLANTYDSITRPVCVKLAKDVAVMTGLDLNNLSIQVPGERGVNAQPSTTMGLGDQVGFGSSSRVECEVDETPRSSTLMATQVRLNNDNKPVVYDLTLGVFVRPVYIQHDLTFRFKFRASSMHEARRWADLVATSYAENRVGNQHTLSYNLVFNDEILAILYEIYKKRELMHGYGEDFNTWFESCQYRPVHVKGAVSGSKDQLVLEVEEHQAHVVGYFEGVTEVKEQRQDQNVSYETEFTYKISYMKAVRWNMVYPFMVHQQHIDPDYFDMTNLVDIDDLDTNHSRDGWRALERIVWSQRGRSQQPIGGLRYPYYDDWFKPEGPSPWTLPIMTWLLSLDPNEPDVLVDLKDLPDMALSPNTFRYIKENRDAVVKVGNALVLFTIYDGDQPLDGSILTLGEDMVLRLTRPLSFRSTYRVRMSVVTSDTILKPNVLDRASEFPRACLEIFQTALPNLDVEWAMVNAVDEGVMDTDYMYWVFNVLENRSIGSNGSIPMKRRVFVNPLPEVRVTVERNVGTKAAVGPKDPGSYSGTNNPDAEDVVDAETLFEFETEEDYRLRKEAKNSISPRDDGEIPVINNYQGLYTTQFLAIFVYKR